MYKFRLCTFILLFQHIFGALPNDECSGAIELNDGANSVSNVGADRNPTYLSNCVNGYDYIGAHSDVWYV